MAQYRRDRLQVEVPFRGWVPHDLWHGIRLSNLSFPRPLTPQALSVGLISARPPTAPKVSWLFVELHDVYQSLEPGLLFLVLQPNPDLVPSRAGSHLYLFFLVRAHHALSISRANTTSNRSLFSVGRIITAGHCHWGRPTGPYVDRERVEHRCRDRDKEGAIRL